MEEDQVAEVKEVKTKLGSVCRVIKDVGDFSHVVNIRPADMDIVFKFQLPASYPKVPPEILIQSKTLQPDDLDLLRRHLASKAKTLLGKAMIVELEGEAQHWLEARDYDVVLATNQNKLESAKAKKKKKKGKKKVEEESDLGPEKKASMKTAEDVISRILWDDSLPTECFRVGYMDRFRGIVEKNFTAFSWEDIASVDYNVLAVPKHRIHYFKYKDLTVWDKGQRLDLVFGSTGSQGLIADHIADYERRLAENPESGGGQVGAAWGADSDDDDGVVIETSRQVPGEGEGDQGVHGEMRVRPNYFLCVRLTDDEIREGVAAFQDAILEVEPRYAPCCVPPAALHVTLCTLGLDTPEELAAARELLRASRDELTALASSSSNNGGGGGIELKVEGLDHFYRRVLYGRVHHGPDFSLLVSTLRGLVTSSGLSLRDGYDYVPHMTLLKTSKLVMSGGLHTKDIDPFLYQSFNQMRFGVQRVDAIHLCPMSDERGEDGFYRCVETVELLLATSRDQTK